MTPFDTRAPYLNLAENPTDVPSGFRNRGSARRLAELKAAHDPDGLFHANHEIDPA